MRPLNSLLITGGAGFIGSAFIRTLLRSSFSGQIVNLDLLTYAGDLANLEECANHPHYHFIQGDINDRPLLLKLCAQYQIDTLVHFAAETHVDRSIESSSPFIDTNIKGTWNLLELIRSFPHIHFHHVSTDEVYGALGSSGFFNESSPYAPNSPYAASKAASDHLVRAYAHTYSLSTTLSHCSNNYGPAQHPEKFIPRMLTCCLEGKPLPVYGNGLHVRDWLYVEDHAEAILAILQRGRKNETYDIGAQTELPNVKLLYILIDLLKEEILIPEPIIEFVPDRLGHDFRYAIDSSKITRELGWTAKTGLREGLKATVSWYLAKRKEVGRWAKAHILH